MVSPSCTCNFWERLECRILADFLIQSGLAKQIRFHGKRYPWFVSDVTRKDWEWLLNTMIYGQLFPKASEAELESLRRLGARWKVRMDLRRMSTIIQ
jgi:Damage-control phosphatase ARMT1-like domain